MSVTELMVPVPDDSVIVTVDPPVERSLLYASLACTVRTSIDEPSAVIDEVVGVRVDCAAEAVPGVTSNALLSAGVNELSIACSAYAVPTVVIWHPAKLTTPLDSLGVQPVRDPGPPEVGVEVVIDKETVELSPTTVLPYWSSIVTCGWGVKVLSAVVVAGEVEKASLLAIEEATVNDVEPITAVAESSVATSVLFEAS